MWLLAERERLKAKVQAIYFDPPYGIKFNSDWQVSTQSRDVEDGKQTDMRPDCFDSAVMGWALPSDA